MAKAIRRMNGSNKSMTIYTYDLDPAFDALAVFECLHHRPFSLLLDSADLAHRDAAYSFVAAFPLEVIEGKDGIYSVTNAKGTQNLKNTNPFDLVRERMRHYKMSLFSFEGGAPFQGGAAGLFGYDLARALESLPNHAKSDPQMPDMALGIYDQVFAYDHKAGKGTLYIHAREAEQADAKHAHYCKMLEQAAPAPAASQDFEPQWQSNFSRSDYETTIQKTIDYIHAGDIFQANISQRFDAQLPEDFDSYAHYLHLREMNAAPFAAYFNLGGVIISSASPERFLTVKDGAVETKPIKGTRPHIRDDKALDTLYRNALENSEKDRAENVMIVDLLRNDLSKTCRPDTIKVSALCALKALPACIIWFRPYKGNCARAMMRCICLKAASPAARSQARPKSAPWKLLMSSSRPAAARIAARWAISALMVPWIAIF